MNLKEKFHDITMLGLIAEICGKLYDKEVRNKMLEVVEECREYLHNKEVE